jgi:spermidine synthase
MMIRHSGITMTKISRLALALLVLFVLSGVAGLLYQSVWSHYLGLSLGHAAYAQTLVLAIFMGGMAIGAWLASRYSGGWHRLILGYAVVEGAIGVFGLVFHGVFQAFTMASQEIVLPAIGNVAVAHAYQWLSAALLIAPQSILLGATFPLMSAGLIRALPDEHGEVLGGLYFTNSLGAAVGALLATFILLPAVGMPGTVLTAGVLNIAVALIAWGISKSIEMPRQSPMPVERALLAGDEGDTVRRLGRILLSATAISGAASFVYEIGWVRLLNQAFGTTIHSFELMLAAFIFGLAFGGLWIRRRAKRIEEPVRYVGYVQVLMAIAALVSIPVFTQSFQWVGWIMRGLSRSDNGYVLFEFATAGVALLVMFPAAFLAGMTLPLFTLALLRAGAGERAIGRIYAANTLGAIAGVALMMHMLIPLIGVRLGVTLGALVDGLVGLYLLRMVNPARMTVRVASVTGALLVATVFSLLMGKPDPTEQVSGVFRTGAPNVGDAAIDYLRDGKTATVAMISRGEVKIIATNGKPDASLSPASSSPTADEITMIMAGALPLTMHPDPKRVAVIGWGSGLTTHTLLGSKAPELVDTVEIEAAMVDGARLYGPRVDRAYSDPRSHVRINDARTFFSTGARKYDAIISEPSNPWVSGVANLFTQEFYAFLKRHLNEGGMLVQWLHAYEISDPLVATMLAALTAEFPYAQVYLTNTADLLVVASEEQIDLPRLALPPGSLRSELARVGIASSEEFALRYIGDRRVLEAFIRMTGTGPHSDYFPTVSLQAPKARFIGQQSSFLQGLLADGMPVLDFVACRTPVRIGDWTRRATSPGGMHSTLVKAHATAAETRRALLSADPEAERRLLALAPAAIDTVMMFRESSSRLGQRREELYRWSVLASRVSRLTLGTLAPQDHEGLWIRPTWMPEGLDFPETQAILDAYAAAAIRNPDAMHRTAEEVLALEAAIAPDMREQMLVIAMIGALGSGHNVEVAKLDERWARTLGGATRYSGLRSFLKAAADENLPSCEELRRLQATIGADL